MKYKCKEHQTELTRIESDDHHICFVCDDCIEDHKQIIGENYD